MLNSFGLGYRLTGAESYKERALNGSKSLYEFRYEVQRSLSVVLQYFTTFSFNSFVRAGHQPGDGYTCVDLFKSSREVLVSSGWSVSGAV